MDLMTRKVAQNKLKTQNILLPILELQAEEPIFEKLLPKIDVKEEMKKYKLIYRKINLIFKKD